MSIGLLIFVFILAIFLGVELIARCRHNCTLP